MKTPCYEWEFPEENDDPYYEKIHTFFDQIDQATFALQNSASNVICPPSSVSWNGLAHTLTWNDDFIIPLMKSGFYLKVQYGPDGVSRSATFVPGQRLVVVIPVTSSGELTANFQVVNSKVAIEHGLFTVGFCYGNRFYANFPQVFI